MLSNREFNQSEMESFGCFGRIRDSSEVAFGERVGIILVHGRAGNENVMWVFSKAVEELDPIVISPRALEVDPIGGYSWWNLDHRPSTVESPAPIVTNEDHLKPSHLVLDKIISELPKRYGVNKSKIITIGFSQGGAVIGTYGLSNPNKLLGAGIISSFIPSYFLNSYKKNTDNKTKFFMSHGTKDEIIPIDRALLVKEFLEKNVDLTFRSDDVAHKISSSGIREFKLWVNNLFNF